MGDMKEQQGAVLVTGASRGLGRGIALSLAAAGFSVAVNYRRNADAARETVAACRKAAGQAAGQAGWEPEAQARTTGPQAGRTGPRFRALQGDVALPEDRERLVAETLEYFGGISGLVNNAGISPRERKDMTQASVDSFEEVLTTNLTGPYFLTQRVVQHWLGEAQAGTEPLRHIVFVTSISAATASTKRGEYCVSKAGLAMAAELWATRLAGEGINVYEIRPGIMETDMTAGVHEKYSRLIGEGLVPQRRWGQGEDIGRMVRSLLSGDFPFSTGAVIYADGGFHISRL